MTLTYNHALKIQTTAFLFLMLISAISYGNRTHDIRLDRFYGGPLAQTSSTYHVHGELAFIGSGMLESLYMHYQISGGEVHTTFFEDIDLNAQIPFFYEADEHWVPEQDGDYDLEIWFSGLNGAPINEGVSDTLLIEVSVYDYLPERELVLLESFSSQNCGSCAIVNPMIRAMVNNNSDKYSLIFYHPLGYENSPLYLYNPRDNDTRRDFYGVNFTPLSSIGALFWGSTEFVDEDLMDLEKQKPAAFSIEGTYHIEDDVIHAQVEATSYASFDDDNLHLLISLTEDEVHFDEPPGSNGEQSFYHVMRAFLPDAGGHHMGNVNVGEVFNVSAEYHLAQGIVDTARVQLHAFVQDFQNKEIYQVSKLSYQVPDDGDDDNGDDDNGGDDNGDDDNGDDDNGDETSVQDPADENQLFIYPNPADNRLFVSVANASEVKNIRIFDLRGRQVKQKVITSHGPDDTWQLNVSSLETGLYLIMIETGDGTWPQKLSISR